MKRFFLILGTVIVGTAVAATSAKAETIAPSDTQKYVGKSVTVEGAPSEVHHAASGKVTVGNRPRRRASEIKPAVSRDCSARDFAARSMPSGLRSELPNDTL